MRPTVLKQASPPISGDGTLTEERCYIVETWNHPLDPGVSLARARVLPGVTTARHVLAVDERYLIERGSGRVEIGGIETDVAPGDVVLIPATTALYRLAPPSFLAGYTFHFKVKQSLDEARLKGQLTLAGYQHVTQVVSPGEYAVRGGLIDLFPMGSPVPYRVDLFDDEIDSIRTFDPDSQRSLYPVN